MNVNDTVQELVELLGHAVAHTRFTVRRYGTFGAPDLRNLYSARHYETLRMVRDAQAETEETSLKHLIDGMRPVLEDVMLPGEDKVPNRLMKQIGIVDVFELERFAKDMIYVAAILGEVQAAQMIVDWADDAPIEFQRFYVLTGISVEGAVALADGVRIEKLPNSTNEIYRRIPWVIGPDRASDFLGRTMIVIDCQSGFDLSKWETNDMGQVWFESSAGMDHFDIDWFCDSLSLSCDNHVSWTKAWRDFGPWTVFAKGSLGHGEQTVVGPGTRVEPDAEDYDVAWRLFKRGRSSTPERVERAMSRWKQSKRPVASLTDRSIDLRIALEALYLDHGDKHGEYRFRLATRGAWHLGGDYQERRDCYRTLRDAYDFGSSAVHASEVDAEKQQALKTAQALCRRGIVKRLDEDGEPDWLGLILGQET